ncbi:MAG TPA: YicC/YloC family endoribonuclease [Nitrospinota bacterium]|nr:YicC/YloC family endoribonuclease [Nitrospinota bacterium]|tara:strand:+ start:2196 stop:3071 length:876 start_codon:yes stop_codon:yes gene_type:complete
MPNSMTGYGRGEYKTADGLCIVESKSVNHRFLEVKVKSSARISQIDDRTRKAVRERFSRGYFEVYLFLEKSKLDSTAEIDERLFNEYLSVAKQLSENNGIEYKPSFDSLIRVMEMFKVPEKKKDYDDCWELVEGALNVSLDQLLLARETEGKNIQQDLTDRIVAVSNHVDEIDGTSSQLVEKRFVALKERMAMLCEGVEIESSRLAQEAGILADRFAISEEITRIKSHLDQVNRLLDRADPIGRKLEFFVQEINREANTIGSKTDDVDTTKLVVEIKSELEKIREQAQNLE